MLTGAIRRIILEWWSVERLLVLAETFELVVGLESHLLQLLQNSLQKLLLSKTLLLQPLNPQLLHL